MLPVILSENIFRIKELCEKHKVEKLYAFGSVCTDNFNKESDIDFLYRFRKDILPENYADNFFDFESKLQKVFDRPIDLVSEEYLSNPYFIKTINRTKALIYG